MIDHASREISADADPGPAGEAFDLRPLIWDAVVRCSGQHNGAFTAKAFGLAIAARFEVAAPDHGWCEQVLNGIDYVTRVGPMGRWKVMQD